MQWEIDSGLLCMLKSAGFQTPFLKRCLAVPGICGFILAFGIRGSTGADSMNRRSIRGSTILSGVVRLNLTEKVRSEQSLEEDEGVHQVDS